MKAYLVLMTLPDGTEGLLFPRPGNVPVAATPQQGWRDFDIAVEHLEQYLQRRKPIAEAGVTLRLVEFERGSVLREIHRSLDFTIEK